jgi:hypothetical protein
LADSRKEIESTFGKEAAKHMDVSVPEYEDLRLKFLYSTLNASNYL